jgi:hypothetical protein
MWKPCNIELIAYNLYENLTKGRSLNRQNHAKSYFRDRAFIIVNHE